MDKRHKIHVKFLDNYGVTYENHTLKEVISHFLKKENIGNALPILLTLDNKKQLYFNNNICAEFVSGEIDVSELIDSLYTEGLYTNPKSFNSGNGVFIDPRALWSLKEKHLFLLDDDRNIFVNFDNDIFKKVK